MPKFCLYDVTALDLTPQQEITYIGGFPGCEEIAERIHACPRFDIPADWNGLFEDGSPDFNEETGADESLPSFRSTNVAFDGQYLNPHSEVFNWAVVITARFDPGMHDWVDSVYDWKNPQRDNLVAMIDWFRNREPVIRVGGIFKRVYYLIDELHNPA